MSITMTELAKQLKLSQATVSLVLNHRDRNRVGAELAAKIRAAAAEAGYRPNRAAGQLRKRKSEVVGVLLPSPENFLYAEMIGEIHHAVRKRGYTPVFSFWEQNGEQRKALDSILGWDVEALITVEPGVVPEGVTLPVATFYNEDLRFDFLGLALERSMRVILAELAAMGHRKVIWLGSTFDSRSGILRRIAPEYGMELSKWRGDVARSPSFASGRAAFDAFWMEYPEDETLPTAIFAHNDMSAIGMIRRMHELNLSVPEHFSVVGHDGLEQGRHITPTLTTFCYSGEKSNGELLTDLAFERLAHPDAPRMRRLIDGILVRGESCGEANTKLKNMRQLKAALL